VTSRVLLLTPSAGLGGGIERYVETLEWAFESSRVPTDRLDLGSSGVRGQTQMLSQGVAMLRKSQMPTRLVVAHRALLPVSALLAHERCVTGVSVICHGSDVWGSRRIYRRSVENWLMRRAFVRVVAVSNYTAGALAGTRPATVLPPGLSEKWFRGLVEASAQCRRADSSVKVVTAFRLIDWRKKGLPVVMDAIDSLGRSDVHLAICGTGEPPAELLQAIHAREHCTLMPSLTDSALARELAAADLLVLGTRMASGRCSSGEGFGLALLEAQIAGTPVVAPAFGGSRDAYVEGMTGLAPADESTEALAAVLSQMIADRSRLAAMGRTAANWARAAFDPEIYARRAVSSLLEPDEVPWSRHPARKIQELN